VLQPLALPFGTGSAIFAAKNQKILTKKIANLRWKKAFAAKNQKILTKKIANLRWKKASPLHPPGRAEKEKRKLINLLLLKHGTWRMRIIQMRLQQISYSHQRNSEPSLEEGIRCQKSENSHQKNSKPSLEEGISSPSARSGRKRKKKTYKSFFVKTRNLADANHPNAPTSKQL